MPIEWEKKGSGEKKTYKGKSNKAFSQLISNPASPFPLSPFYRPEQDVRSIATW